MIKTSKHLAYVLKFRENDLAAIVKNISHYYSRKVVNKTKFGSFQIENGQCKKRIVYPSLHPLRNLQANISSLLQSIQLPDFTCGSTKGKNNILNALQHVNNEYFFTVDLRDFFSNINRHQVYQALVRENFSPTVARILTQLTTYDGKLPQGPPSSPVISNLVFVETGIRLQEFSHKHGITFTCYLDDLTFSSTQCFKHLTSAILNIIKSGHFYPHNKKIKYQVKCCEVTGIYIRNRKVFLPIKILDKAKENSAVNGYILYFGKCSKQLSVI
jgi:RNA-directed DNA polymerase